MGTEAGLHQVARADVVAFLDLDQELLAPRYRAAEQALGLVARAARLVGGRERGGRLLLQTHVPDHEVVQAAVLGDPTRVADAEAERRHLLRFPPVTALAEVSGPAAADFVATLRGDAPRPPPRPHRRPRRPPSGPTPRPPLTLPSRWACGTSPLRPPPPLTGRTRPHPASPEAPA